MIACTNFDFGQSIVDVFFRQACDSVVTPWGQKFLPFLKTDSRTEGQNQAGLAVPRALVASLLTAVASRGNSGAVTKLGVLS